MASLSPSTSATISTPTPTPMPSIQGRSLRAEERRIKGVVWRLIDTPSIRRKQDNSGIWSHGARYINIDRPRDPPHFICHHCNTVMKPSSSQSTSNYLRHLKRRHDIILDRQETEEEEAENEEDSVVAQSQVTSRTVTSRTLSALVTSINIDRWRQLLLRYIIECQVPYSVVKQPQFRELLIYAQPSIQRYLVQSGNSIKSWVEDEYRQGCEAVKVLMKGALSRIHLSIDVWTSPSRIPILGICSHFLDNSLCMRHPLLALRYLPDRHTGPAMAQVVQEVMRVYEMLERWGVLVADNATNNDTCCEALVTQLCPDEDSETARRARCFGHMVNLAAKAFIYGV